LAIVLGLALQNTLADVFAGLALNVEHPFRAGNWITIDDVEGEVMEINWRATRIRSRANDLIMIPNSVIAKAIVNNHRRLNSPHVITIGIAIDHHFAPARVIDALQSAAKASLGISTHTPPTVYACRFEGATVAYELHVGIDEFAALAKVQSTVIRNTVDILNGKNVPIGPLPDAGVAIPIGPSVPEPARLALAAR
jgi:small-conductance mechanosensitive channel